MAEVVSAAAGTFRVVIPPRLVPVLGSSVRAINEERLNALETAGVSEDQDLDFKQARYDHGPKGTFEISKDVAAMANQVGGLIVIGVAEDDQARAAGLTPMKLDDDERVRMLTVIAQRVHPMVPGLDVHMFESEARDGTGYYVIAVPHSASAPHSVRKPEQDKDTPWCCYPLRHGTTTIYLSEAQIAARYRDRFELARTQVDRLERLYQDNYKRSQGSPDTAALAVGIVPAVAGHRPVSGQGNIEDYFDLWKPGGSRIAPKAGRYQIVLRVRLCGTGHS
jgi:hypothetical protein